MSTAVACLLATSVLLAWTAARPATASTAVGVVAGQVSGASSPLDAAKVYAYRLTDLSLRKVATDSQGRFFFSELPAGLYKVIAHSKGFVPSVVMLARSSAGTDQFLDLELLRQGPQRDRGADFWAVRRQIPNDVLRDMGWPLRATEPPVEEPEVVAEPVPVAPPQAAPSQGLDPLQARGRDERALRLPDLPGGQLRANLEAVTGMDETVSGNQLQMTGGQADIDARLGATELGIQASFMELEDMNLEDGAATFAQSGGSDQAFALQLRSGDDRLSLRSRQSDLLNGLSNVGLAGGDVELEQYQLSWSRPVGERGRSELRAQYTDESNFYRNGWFTAGDLPSGSRTLSVEGAYSTEVGDEGRFETELRYRERQNVFDGDLYGGGLDPLLPEQYETVELLSQGGWRMRPAVVVEYGMFTTLRDGSLSLTPRGSVLWQVNPAWEASLSVSHRLDTGDPRSFRDFMPALYRETSGCQQGEEYCYQVSFAHRRNDDERFTVSALDREFGETLRLYFSEDFFRQLESVYLVDGDRLPELQVALSRRISPRVVATVESNLASGGGGLIYALGDGAYENQVRYLVTSVDTQFQATSTGVFVAFHQLQQELEPTREDQFRVPDMEQERLQLMLTQDLNFLLDLASTWAVKLNMEISRGHGLFTADQHSDELRKRFLGGLAVRF